jgi:hypothetical protein
MRASGTRAPMHIERFGRDNVTEAFEYSFGKIWMVEKSTIG